MMGAAARSSTSGGVSNAASRRHADATNSVRPCDQQKEPGTGTRLDKWLFHARFYRTRVLAQTAAARGKVRLNGTRVEKPAQMVRPGDVLTLGRGGEILAIRILALAQRRGPAGGAQALYEIVADESLDKPGLRP